MLKASATFFASLWLLPRAGGAWTSIGSSWFHRPPGQSFGAPGFRGREVLRSTAHLEVTLNLTQLTASHAEVAHNLRGCESNKALGNQRGRRLRGISDLTLEVSVSSRLSLLCDLEDDFAKLHAQLPSDKFFKSPHHHQRDCRTMAITRSQGNRDNSRQARESVRRNCSLPSHIDVAQTASSQAQDLEYPAPPPPNLGTLSTAAPSTLDPRHQGTGHPRTLGTLAP